MAKKDTFEKMYTLYNAIVDIDKIVNSPTEFDANGECKLDQVLFYVRDIPKKDYPPEYTLAIISSIRASIVELYNRTIQEVNQDIIPADNNSIVAGLTKPSVPNMEIPQFVSRSNTNNQIMKPERYSKNFIQRGTVHAGSKTD